MLKILFKRNKNVYLPEIEAYKAYLDNLNSRILYIDSKEYDEKKLVDNDFDVIWKFMGIDKNREKINRYIVHEYGSLSVPPFAKAKNHLKKLLNIMPYHRVFLNSIVENQFGFNDNIPTFFRDMGVDKRFFIKEKSVPEYDFVYCGSLYRGNYVLNFLDHFSRRYDLGKLLVVGDVRPKDEKKYSQAGNIIFTGRVTYSSVPLLLTKAKFALNLIPNIYPFNVQTSTKILEYSALNMPIISSKYCWAVSFEKQRGGKFYWLPNNLDELNLISLEKYDFITPNVENLEWINLIKNSRIFDFLSKI